MYIYPILVLILIDPFPQDSSPLPLSPSYVVQLVSSVSVEPADPVIISLAAS